MPYIIIISLGATLQLAGKFVAVSGQNPFKGHFESNFTFTFQSLSASTAFCYAWRFIMRTELQQKELGFSNAFDGDFADNDFKFGFIMIIVDTIIYATIGTICEKFLYGTYVQPLTFDHLITPSFVQLHR